MKKELNKLTKTGEVTTINIYSKNHFNFFKLLYKEVKGESYRGANLPSLCFRHEGVFYSVLSNDLEHQDGFNDSEDFLNVELG